METFEVIIVGAGPAGLSTALHLVKLMPELAERILVLESERHPRPKLCAGGVLKDGEYILESLGLDSSEVPCQKINEAYFLFEGKGICIKRYPESFMIIRREEFDAWLVKEARKRGIRVQEETRVLSIETSTSGKNIHTEKGVFFSPIVVGADGVNSVTRRAITEKSGSNQSIALEFFVDPHQYKKMPHQSSNQAFFDFSIISEHIQGYIWQFPTQESGETACTRGLYHARIKPDNAVPVLKDVLRKYLSLEKLNLDDYELKGHPIRYFDPKSVFSAPGILLVGDAAGVDPIYGEGISFALGYGALAAEEIKEAIAKQNFSFINYKKRILRHPMGRCLKRRFRVARILYHFGGRSFQRLLWWHLGFILKWYIEHFLIDWAKSKKPSSRINVMSRNEMRS